MNRIKLFWKGFVLGAASLLLALKVLGFAILMMIVGLCPAIPFLLTGDWPWWLLMLVSIPAAIGLGYLLTEKTKQ